MNAIALAAVISLAPLTTAAAAEPATPVETPATSAEEPAGGPGGEPAAPAAERPAAPRATGPVDPAPPTAEEPRRTPPPKTVSGTVRSFDASPARVVIEAEGGALTVPVDRNTAVYLQSGAGTIRDVKPGERVRVSVTGPENRALWLEVMTGDVADKASGSAATPPTVPPGETAAPQGVGPPGSTPPPAGPATPAGPAGPGR